MRGPAETGGDYSLKSFTTSKIYDSVEVMVSNTEAAAQPFEPGLEARPSVRPDVHVDVPGRVDAAGLQLVREELDG